VNANLTFEIVGYDPEEGKNLFAINKVDVRMASILLKNNLLNKWGEYTLKVKVSSYFETNS
jgi:hypothetical protein